jgi:anthranilate synthase component 1
MLNPNAPMIASICAVDLAENTLERILMGIPEDTAVGLLEFSDMQSRKPTFSIVGLGHSFRHATSASFRELAEQRVAMGTASAPLNDLPFSGGAVGFLPYQSAANPGPGLFLTTERLIVRDHLSDRGWMIAYGDEQGAPSEAALRREFEQLKRAGSGEATAFDQAVRIGAEWRQTLDEQGYIEAVQKAKRLIQDGHISQVIVSLQMMRNYNGPTFALYRSLRSVNTAAQNFYLRFPTLTLLGTPPSAYLTIADGKAEMEVGAGTRPVTGDAAIDDRVAAELAADPKERDEHDLLVDETRAVLGRIAQERSVEMPVSMQVRRFSHVMHLFSVLTAALDESRAPAEALAAALPPAPVVGVPTAAAAEAIATLERTARGPYGGVYVMADFGGNISSAIIERSMWIADNQVVFRVGAGITAESVPEAEYAECLRKAAALMSAVERVGS